MVCICLGPDTLIHLVQRMLHKPGLPKWHLIIIILITIIIITIIISTIIIAIIIIVIVIANISQKQP